MRRAIKSKMAATTTLRTRTRFRPPKIRLQCRLRIQYPVGRPFMTIEKNAWRSSLFQCIGQDLKQSPAIIEVTAKSDFNTFKTLLQTHYFREAFNL